MTFVWSTSHVGMLYPLDSGGKKANLIARDFLSFAEASLNKVTYDIAKTHLSVRAHQAETRKAFFQELGLLYVPERSNRIQLTPVGKQFADLLQSIPSDESVLTIEQILLTRQKVDSLLIWALCNSQLDRPSSFGSPKQSLELLKTCNVRPYAAFWQAMRDLNGFITLNEFLGKLAMLHDVRDYSNVINEIRERRIAKNRLPLTVDFTDNYIIYWKSHLTIADQILRFDTLQFEFLSSKQKLIEAILKLRMCDAESVETAIHSQEWRDEEEYYEEVAGAPCPEFLLRGEFEISNFDKQNIFALHEYDLEKINDSLVITGGRELCQLPLKAVCFHENEPGHLLRLDSKTVMKYGKVKLSFGFGRPINNLSTLKDLLK